MNLHEFSWDCFVALVYILTFIATALLLIADWRLIFGKDQNPPWAIIVLVSLLGPIGLCAAFTVYSIDKVRHHGD